MGVEHLQQFDVRGDDGDEVAPVPALQFGGAETAQSPEHLVPDEGQQLEGDEVVAGLLGVAEQPPHQRKQQHADEYRRQGDGRLEAQQVEDGKAPENGDERRTEVAHQSHEDGEDHVPAQGFHQSDELCHDGKTAPLFHSAASSP